MSKQFELASDQLVRRCEPESLGFSTTESLDGREAAVGQDRAVSALQLGVAMQQGGFNVFVLGQTGSGRSTLARALISSRALHAEVPPDVCYVHDFDQPRKPKAMRLPPGQGVRLRDHMARVIEELQTAIPLAFDTPAYRERHEAIEQETEQTHERELSAIADEAKEHGVAVVRTPGGFALAPMRDGKVMSPEQQEKLDADERARLSKYAEALQERLQAALKRVPQLQRQQRERERRLKEEVTRETVVETLHDVRRAFGELPEVLQFLDAVSSDLIQHASQGLRSQTESETEGPLGPLLDLGGLRESPLWRRYRVNVMVDHRLTEGAPVITLDHPTTGNLVGKVEHQSHFGVLITDFNLIKPGALHLANGGYLMIDARRLLMQPVAYEQLKRALRSREIRIESVQEALDLTQTVTLEPEPISLEVKVILIGERDLYYRLSALDPEFEELFKVAAEIDSSMPRNEASMRAYAGLIARVIRSEQLRPMDAPAMARVLDHATRLAEDVDKLSMHVRAVFDLVREAAHWAGEAGREVTGRQDVEQALAARADRHGLLKERVHESIERGSLRVQTSGRVVGQINGLSVVELGQAAFGFPSRLSARVRLGKGDVIAIDREVKLGGPIHNKGVLILSSCLGSRYLPDRPSSLQATLVFEQLYGFVEGDSASLAELLVLLSAIGGLPLPQGIAVTGSVDQHGNVQMVGGVNEKIEGFFEACDKRELDGKQGVILPRSNTRSLMLEQRVVDAVAAGRFHIYAVDSVDQAAEVMFGLAAGERDSSGKYPQASVNGRVEASLASLSRAAIAVAREARATGDETP